MQYPLEERTAVFGERIIEFCKKVPKNVITIPIINQLIRSGLSIGANYQEANGASSKKDFKNKIFSSFQFSNFLFLKFFCELQTSNCELILGQLG
jgi:hypothetical protein